MIDPVLSAALLRVKHGCASSPPSSPAPDRGSCELPAAVESGVPIQTLGTESTRSFYCGYSTQKVLTELSRIFWGIFAAKARPRRGRRREQLARKGRDDQRLGIVGHPGHERRRRSTTSRWRTAAHSNMGRSKRIQGTFDTLDAVQNRHIASTVEARAFRYSYS